jgi:hypothetical protein
MPLSEDFDTMQLGVDENAVVIHDLDEDTTLVLTDLSALKRVESVHSRLLTRAKKSNIVAKSQLQIVTPQRRKTNYRHPECYKYIFICVHDAIRQ